MALVIAAMTLSSCLYLPGRYESLLRISRNGQFEFQYSGQIRFAPAGVGKRNAADSETWSDMMAYCYDEKGQLQTARDKAGQIDPSCTPEKVAERKLEWERKHQEQREEEAMIVNLLGFNPFNDADNHAIAEKLMRYDGWKQVRYRGRGIFDVEYAITGKTDRDFIFPTIPGVQINYPFVSVRRRTDNEVEIKAPGLAGSGLTIFLRNSDIIAQSDDPESKASDPRYWIAGTFVIEGDKQFESENGEAAGLNRIQWQIDGTTALVPEAEFLLDDILPTTAR